MRDRAHPACASARRTGHGLGAGLILSSVAYELVRMLVRRGADGRRSGVGRPWCSIPETGPSTGWGRPARAVSAPSSSLRAGHRPRGGPRRASWSRSCSVDRERGWRGGRRVSGRGVLVQLPEGIAGTAGLRAGRLASGLDRQPRVVVVVAPWPAALVGATLLAGLPGEVNAFIPGFGGGAGLDDACRHADPRGDEHAGVAAGLSRPWASAWPSR